MTTAHTAKAKSLGQYFTISDELQTFVWDHVAHKSSPLLEPSFGAGHLLQRFLASDPKYPMTCCELDATIPPVVQFTSEQVVVYGDFLQQTFDRTFRTIIGNPPYVKTTTSNLYVQFVERCVDLLADDGEMIFIVPSDFLKLTSAAPLLNRMMSAGSFSHLLFPNNERLFSAASVDVVVFRYEKGRHSNDVLVNGKPMICRNSNGIITVSEGEQTGTLVEDLFNVYVGLVSGRDAVFKSALGRHEILCDKSVTERFILEKSFPTGDVAMDTHLLAHKQELLDRKIRSFNETNWFEWGAPRNRRVMEEHAGEPCIYVRNVTRKDEVAWKGTVQQFGGTLLCMIPKRADVDLDAVVRVLNTPQTKLNYIYSGRFKIGQRQLCNVRV